MLLCLLQQSERCECVAPSYQNAKPGICPCWCSVQASTTVKGQSVAPVLSSILNLLQSLDAGLKELEHDCNFLGNLDRMKAVCTGRHIPNDLRRPAAVIVRDLGVTT